MNFLATVCCSIGRIRIELSIWGRGFDFAGPLAYIGGCGAEVSAVIRMIQEVKMRYRISLAVVATLLSFPANASCTKMVNGEYMCSSLEEQSMANMMSSQLAEQKKQIESDNYYATQQAIESQRLIMMPDGRRY
jgi:hypothetical protein